MNTNERIEIAETRIKELQLLINHWRLETKASDESNICSLLNKTDIKSDLLAA